MAQTVKNVRINWTWVGDTDAIKKFRVAVTKNGDSPINASLAQAVTDGSVSQHTFTSLVLDTTIQYTGWVQAVYEGDDSDWVNSGGLIQADDGLASLQTTGGTAVQINTNNELINQLSSSVNPNWTFRLLDSLGLPAGLLVTGGSSTRSLLSAGTASDGTLLMASGNYAAVFPAIAINRKSKYNWVTSAKASAAIASGFAVIVYETTVTPAIPPSWVGSNDTFGDQTGMVRSVRTITLQASSALTTAFGTKSGVYTPSTDATYVSFAIVRDAGSGANIIEVDFLSAIEVLPTTLAELDSVVNTTINAALNVDGTIKAARVSTAAFAAGIEPIAIVTTLPTPAGYTGPKTVYLTTDGKLYRYVAGAWTAAVPTTDLSGTVSSAQIADAAITTAKFASGIQPVAIVASLPTPAGYTGPSTVLLSTDGKLYRYFSGTWTAAVPTLDLSGQITTTQITDDAVTTAKVAANAITANEIAANTITAAQIAADTITAAQIAAGAISASEIAAGAITASKIFVGDPSNLVLNPEFKQGLDGWTTLGTPTSIAAEDIGVVSDTRRYRVRIQGGAANSLKWTRVIEVQPGESYYIQCDAYNSNATAAAVGFYYEYRDNAGTLVGSGTVALSSASTWVQPSGRFTVPAAGKTLSLFTSAATPANVTYFTNFRARRALTGELVVDGTITASHIAANTITAGQIAANTITASQIAANTITAGQIAAGAITTSELAASAVTATKIFVGDLTNILRDSEFLDSTVGQAALGYSAGVIVRDASHALATGQPKLRYFTITVRDNSGPTWPVIPGEAFYISAYQVTGAGQPNTSQMLIEWRNAANANIGFSGVWTAPTTTTTWTKFDGIVTAPANAAFARLYPLINSTAGVQVQEWALAAPIVRRAASGELVVDGAITADKIAANTITANEIAAGAISADRLSIGAISENMAQNGGFETGTTAGWAQVQVSGGGTTLAATTADKTEGLYSGLITKTATANGAGYGTRAIPVNPGETYKVSMKARGSAATANGFFFRILYSATKPANEFFTSATGTTQDLVANGAFATAWTAYEFTWTCPAGVYWANINFYNWTNGPLQSYHDDIRFSKQVSTVDIKDGTITTPKIVVGAATASTVSTTALSSTAWASGTSSVSFDSSQVSFTSTGSPLKVFYLIGIKTGDTSTNSPLPTAAVTANITYGIKRGTTVLTTRELDAALTTSFSAGGGATKTLFLSLTDFIQNTGTAAGTHLFSFYITITLRDIDGALVNVGNGVAVRSRYTIIVEENKV